MKSCDSPATGSMGGKVESAPQIKYRSVLDYDHPITWIDTGEGSEEQENSSLITLHFTRSSL